MEDVRIGRRTVIPGRDLDLRVSRSGGPGGQGVNTTDTKVELRFDLAGTRALTGAQKALARERLANRITTDGVLIVQSSEHRSQHQNRQAALTRFQALLSEAIRPPRSRTPTRPTRGAKRRRLEAKRRRGEAKRLRRPPET